LTGVETELVVGVVGADRSFAALFRVSLTLIVDLECCAIFCHDGPPPLLRPPPP